MHSVRYQHICFDDWEYNFEEGDLEVDDEYLQNEDADAKPALFSVMVLDTPAIAMADSGASVSLCSDDLWKKVNSILSQLKLTPARNVILVDFSGTRKKCVIGEVVLPIKIDTFETYFHFFVVKGL